MSTEGRRIPDWEDSSAYPLSYDDIYEGDWRWEFLRRYPKYRQAWERGIPDTENNNPKDIENIRRKPAPQDCEFCSSVLRMTHLVDPWGLQRITNGPTIAFTLGTGAVTLNPPLPDTPRGRDFMMVGFDLRKPLKPQIDEAYGKLKFQQKAVNDELVTFKKHKELWPRYIRVIDAFDQGATPTEIYTHFAEESAGGNENKLDDFFRPGSQPDATAMNWRTRALSVMELAVRLL